MLRVCLVDRTTNTSTTTTTKPLVPVIVGFGTSELRKARRLRGAAREYGLLLCRFVGRYWLVHGSILSGFPLFLGTDNGIDFQIAGSWFIAFARERIFIVFRVSPIPNRARARLGNR